LNLKYRIWWFSWFTS